ncbi:VOC family protein [Kordiimonas gwangyangensis]|uniref:VOC family protein n=1 Tax=Kordiimonas gwangyangensis TaxID=288022 RepID=UPI00035E7983|nr:VOC family protein [Kordiimonas gwangyangensis]
MLEKVAFTVYPVTDVPRARAFYEGLLGLDTHGTEKIGKEMAWIEYDLPGGGCFAIANFTENTPHATAGGTIAFEVNDLDALLAHLKSNGVEFMSDMTHSPACRMAVCLDPDGNSILLHQLKNK